LAEVLAVVTDNRGGAAVCVCADVSHCVLYVCRHITLCSVELPHAWIFSLCSSLDLQKWQQEFCILLRCLTLLMVVHSHVAAH